jgi:hypothetical protein
MPSDRWNEYHPQRKHESNHRHSSPWEGREFARPNVRCLFLFQIGSQSSTSIQMICGATNSVVSAVFWRLLNRNTALVCLFPIQRWPLSLLLIADAGLLQITKLGETLQPHRCRQTGPSPGR